MHKYVWTLSSALWLIVAVVVSSLSLAGPAHAQSPCDPQWLPGGGVPGVQGHVYATAYADPDGSGPLPESLIVVGRFDVAGSNFASNIARWNELDAQWHPVGAGLSNSSGSLASVYDICTLPSGDLVVTGTFNQAGGNAALGVARWEVATSQWRSMGSGFSNGTALAFLPTGELIAAGSGGVRTWAPSNSTWTTLAPVTSGVIHDVIALPDGRVVVGGMFQALNGFPSPNVVAWNTNTGQWEALSTGTNDDVRVLAVLNDGTLLAGGDFTLAGGVSANGIARWDGVAWSPLGAGIGITLFNGGARALAVLPNGEVVVGGYFSQAGGVSSYNLALWHSETGVWSPVVLGANAQVESLALIGQSAVVVGGRFWHVGGKGARGVALWDFLSNQWRALGSGMNATVNAIAVKPNGDVVIGGDFLASHSDAPSFIATRRLANTGWTDVGSGLNSNVNALLAAPTGSLIAGGMFTQSAETSVSRIARWDAGEEWASLGSGVNGDVLAVQPWLDNQLLAGGYFTTAGGAPARYIARFDPASGAWSELAPGLDGGVRALLPLASGDLVVGGFFRNAGSLRVNYVAKWNVQTEQWSAMGTGMDAYVHALAALPNGDIIAGGGFASAGGIIARKVARWSEQSQSWSPLGTGLTGGDPGSFGVQSLKVMENGDVLAGGDFTHVGATPVNYIARWSAQADQWQPLSTGVSGVVRSIVSLPNNELGVGGAFTQAGNQVSARFARWVETPIPWVAEQPQADFEENGSTLVVSAVPATGYSNVAYRWRRNGVDVVDGPEGASVGGGLVSDASGPLFSPTNGQSARLTIEDAQSSDGGLYTVVFYNACGESASEPVTVSISPLCPADFDSNGTREVPDIFAFLSAWFAQDPAADFDGVPGITVPDIFAFLSAWFAGCP